jgi:SNF2 family DNA or RNA helicase
MTTRRLKVIVFSEFRESYEYFGDRLIRRFGGACVADYSYGGTRSQELHKFIHQPECFVMLLSKQGSVGLDLSFVTHIFFLNSVFDKSLEAQVVARAYRMGATGPVHVEVLIANNTIEELMVQIKEGESNQSESSLETNETRAKVHQLLTGASLIRPSIDHTTVKKRKATEEDQEQEKMHRTRVRFQE